MTLFGVGVNKHVLYTGVDFTVCLIATMQPFLDHGGQPIC